MRFFSFLDRIFAKIPIPLQDFVGLPIIRLQVWILPRPTSGRGLAYRSGYAGYYYACEAAVIDWHKRKLAELDWEYAEQQGSFALVRAGERAQQQDIGPFDPQYPQLEDFRPGFKKFLERDHS